MSENPRARRRAHERKTRRAQVALVAAFVVVASIGVAWAARSLSSGAAPEGAGSGAAPGVAVATAAPLATPRATAAVPASGSTASAEPSGTISVIAVGDLLFSLGPRSLIQAKGGAAPLAKVAAILRSADLTIANLETTLSNRGAPVAGKPAHLIFNGDPRGILSITSAGIDIVDQANNHAMDHGAIALKDTIATLDKAGVRHAGAGLNVTEAWKPVIMTVKGRRVAFVAATQVVPAHFTPSATRAGVAVGTPISRVAAAVRAVRTQVDIVIVSIHWGVEQSLTANAKQKAGARALIDAGADLVLCHHPHVMQGIDFYKGKLIAYSLGNFLFPYKTTQGRKSFILRFDYGPKGVANITATPVYLGSYGAPAVQTGSSAAAILGQLAAISKPFGTKVTIRDGIGYITH